MHRPRPRPAHLGVTLQQPPHVLLQPLKQRRVADEPILDDLCSGSSSVAAGDSGQAAAIKRRKRHQRLQHQPAEHLPNYCTHPHPHLHPHPPTGDARGQLPVGQRVERVGVDQHAARLVERANHVLAQRVVDAGLAAHRGVDLGHDGGGHLDEVHAALVGRRRKASHVAYHAAAQRDERRVAVQPARGGATAAATGRGI